MKLGPLFLGLWLILTGLMGLIELNFIYDELVMGVLAIIAGALTLIRQ